MKNLIQIALVVAVMAGLTSPAFSAKCPSYGAECPEGCFVMNIESSGEIQCGIPDKPKVPTTCRTARLEKLAAAAKKYTETFGWRNPNPEDRFVISSTSLLTIGTGSTTPHTKAETLREEADRIEEQSRVEDDFRKAVAALKPGACK